jgi:hypothetical protein
MGAKRLLSIYAVSAGPGVSVLLLLRRSFQHYARERLTISCFVCAPHPATFLMGIFLISTGLVCAGLSFHHHVVRALHLRLSLRGDSVA